MTFKKLKEIIKKNNIPEDVHLLSDSGWEFDASEMNGIFYNKNRNEIVFVQYAPFSKYLKKEEYELLYGGIVIFLDVDGVLNNDLTKDLTPIGSIGVDDENLAQLKHLIDKTKADIVLTSDWRFDKDAVNYLNKRLSEHNLTLYDKIAISHNYEHRGKEIKAWLQQHSDVRSFVIIDDLCFPDFEKYRFSERLIKTDAKYGLRKEDVDTVIERLFGV